MCLLNLRIDINTRQILGRTGDQINGTYFSWVIVPSPLPSQVDVRVLSALSKAVGI